ncbi:MAG TPA: hypothetical protein VL285_01670 [Bryobacteraceae bacterium]|jgi:hypothetical protein|nr:hypothetical protein [Bryobacteraceae bacterium]
MREFTKALFSYSLSIPFFGLKQAQNIVLPGKSDDLRSPAVKAFESVTHATIQQFGEPLGSVFRMMDNIQRGLIGFTFSVLQTQSDSRAKESRRREEEREEYQWTPNAMDDTELERSREEMEVAEAAFVRGWRNS